MTDQSLIALLDRAIESIGSFCSDQGWATSDMETLDDLIAARAEAAQPAAQEPDELLRDWIKEIGVNPELNRWHVSREDVMQLIHAARSKP